MHVPKHEQRFGLSSNLKSFSLPHCEEVCPIVLSHNRAHVRRHGVGPCAFAQGQVGAIGEHFVIRVNLNDVTAFHRQLLLEEFRQPHFANEAKAL